MSKLEDLDLGYNSFHGIISETLFSNLSKLQTLGLSEVVLDFHSDWVPPFQLRDIYLGSCKMGPHFPKWLRTQKNYRSLDISDAGISDVLPNWFWHLSNEVTSMDLSRNQIIGRFPDFVLDFAFSPRLNLSQNQFEGAISLSILSQAVSVDLSYNNFTSLTPFSCTGTISGLRYLDLSRNKISQEISGCWRDLENLIFLDLSRNNFFGKIPTTMGYLSSLQTLKLNDNRFVGELPSSLKNCTTMSHFNVGKNKLSGLVPEWLGVSFPNLVILILRSNNFYGSIPPQICHLTKILILDLSMNKISGSIPNCINNLTTLKQNLSGTSDLTISHTVSSQPQDRQFFFVYYEDEESIMWKGVESKYKSTLGLVKSIDLSSNRLSGEIPREISHLVGLVSLNLSRNHLTGQISPEMGMLRSLESLDLSRNELYGSIPRSLFQIYGLGDLDLSYNNLSGEIPIGSQLQNYESSKFVGNPLLCGIPLDKMCDSKKQNKQGTSDVSNEEDGLITKGFYISMALGFIFAFWGVFGSLMIRAIKRDPRLSGTSRHRCVRQYA